MPYIFKTQYNSDPVQQGVAPGLYYATCVSTEEKCDKNGNMGMVTTWQFQYQGKPREMKYWYSYSRNMEWKMERLVRCMGATYDAGAQFEFGPALVQGRKVWLVVGKSWRQDKGRLQSAILRPAHMNELPQGVTVPGRELTEQEILNIGLNSDATDPNDKKTQDALLYKNTPTASADGGGWGDMANSAPAPAPAPAQGCQPAAQAWQSQPAPAQPQQQGAGGYQQGQNTGYVPNMVDDDIPF